jgi:hypothetical protein
MAKNGGFLKIRRGFLFFNTFSYIIYGLSMDHPWSIYLA